MAPDDYCRLCKVNMRESGPSGYGHSTHIFVSKTTPNISERLAIINLIVAPEPEQSNRCCQRCFFTLGRLEKDLVLLRLWEENVRESKVSKRQREPSPSETLRSLKKTCPNPPSPPAPSGNTTTKVTINYVTQTLTRECGPEEDPIIKSIVLNRWKTAANHALKHRHLQEELKDAIIKLIRKECDELCSRKNDFVLWKSKPADLKTFSFKSLRNDLHRLAPFLLSIFSCVTDNNNLASCTAAAIAIRGRQPRLAALSYWINRVLQSGGAKKSVYNHLSKLSITTSHTKAVIKRQELALDCEADFLPFKSVLEATDTEESEGSESLEDLHQSGNTLSLKQQPPQIKEEPEEQNVSQEEEQLLEENQRRQQLLEENQRRQQLLEESQRRPQLLEENQRRQQLLERDQWLQKYTEKILHQKRANMLELKQQPLQIKEEREEQNVSQEEEQLLEENQRRPQLLEENQRRPQLLEENQRRPQLLEEALSPQLGAEDHYFANPTQEAVPGLKQENCDDLQIYEVQVEVKEEDPEELSISLPMETHWEDSNSDSNLDSHMDNMAAVEYFSDSSDTGEGEVENWTAPLKEDVSSDGAASETQTQDSNTERDQSAEREFSVFPKNKTLVCSFCKMTFARPCQLRQHMVTHSCSFCQKVCPSEKNLKLHVMLHTGERPFPCPMCDKRCRSRGFLNQHIKMSHSEVRSFSCSVCSAAFKSNHLLRKHMYQHTGKRAFACSLCEESFKRKYELQNHMLKHSHNSQTA